MDKTDGTPTAMGEPPGLFEEAIFGNPRSGDNPGNP